MSTRYSALSRQAPVRRCSEGLQRHRLDDHCPLDWLPHCLVSFRSAWLTRGAIAYKHIRNLLSGLTEGKGRLSVDTEIILYGILDVVSFRTAWACNVCFTESRRFSSSVGQGRLRILPSPRPLPHRG